MVIHSLRRSVLFLLLLAAGLPAQKPTAPKPAIDGRTLLQKLVERVETLEVELKKLRKAGKSVVPQDPKKQQIVVLIETPFLGAPYYRSTGARFFAAKLVLVNLTPTPQVVKRDSIKLVVDGKKHSMPTTLPATIRSVSFQVGNQSFQMSTLKMAKELSLPAGGSGSTWVIFPDLPQGPHVPKMQLSFAAGKQSSTIDLNARARARLAANVRRIGPRGSLGLMTIAGAIDTINIAALVDQLDTLTGAGVVRSVIRFTDKAPPIESRIYSWLNQAASQAGRGTAVTNSPFPTVPVAIRELHLAAIPNRRSTGVPGTSVKTQIAIKRPLPFNASGNRLRVHPTAEQAIAAALATAYRALPRRELLREIQQGDPLTRPAALASGGGRLATEDLPVILQLTKDDSPAIARAALISLRHFGEEAAVARLVLVANKNQAPLSATAIDSLAASRYPTAHQALLKMLKTIDTKARKDVVLTLARHPRPAFADAIFDFANDPDPGVGAAALQALSGIGHPQLLPILAVALQSSHTVRRDAALAILSKRTDRASEKLALDHVLERLENTPPDNIMNSLLIRTRDPRAIPMLLKHVVNSPANRSILINTLVQIGDQDVAAKLIEHYPKLPNKDRAVVLNAVARIDITVFRKLAADALASNYSSLVSAACRGLQSDASPEAVAMLIKAFSESSSSSTLSYTANALAGVGTVEAKQALEKARSDTNVNKRNYAVNALRSMKQRSPGYQYVSMGRNYSQQLNWKQARDQYDLAIKIDPTLSAGFAGRGSTRLQLGEKLSEIRKDFQKAIELDPLNSQAMSGLAIVLLREGKFDAGLKYAEDFHKKFTSNSSSIRQMQSYNLACVYSRAVEVLKADAKFPDRTNRLALCQKRAFEELNKAVKSGFRNKAWMQKDPDLKAIRDLPEFKKLAGPSTKPARANKVRVLKKVPPGAIKKRLPKAIKSKTKKKAAAKKTKSAPAAKPAVPKR